MNQAKKLKAHHKLIRAKVSVRTGLPVDELNLMCFEGAFTYLRDMMGISEYGVSQLTATRQFWAWWETEWARLDRIFLENLPAGACDARERYELVHSCRMDNTYLNSALMRAGGKALISDWRSGVE